MYHVLYRLKRNCLKDYENALENVDIIHHLNAFLLCNLSCTVITLHPVVFSYLYV